MLVPVINLYLYQMIHQQIYHGLKVESLTHILRYQRRSHTLQTGSSAILYNIPIFFFNSARREFELFLTSAVLVTGTIATVS